MDDELFSRLLPDPVSPLPEVDQLLQDDGRLPGMVEDMPASKKRSSSELDEPPTIPKKSRLHALASLVRMQDLVDSGSLSKKQALMTREKLRAGWSEGTFENGWFFHQRSGAGEEAGALEECRFYIW